MSDFDPAAIQRLLDTQQPELAYAQLLVQLAQTPEQTALWRLLANALIQLERWEQLQLAWESLLALEPSDAECHFQLGFLLQSRGDLDKALKHLQAARAFCPESERYTHALARLYLILGQRENLLLYAQDCLRQQPERPEGFYLLGCAFQLYGRFDDAQAALRQALFLQPNHAHAALQLGLLLLELEDFSQAAFWLSQALLFSQTSDLHPSWPARVQALLGNIYQRQGQPGEAAVHWQEALLLWPDFQACAGLALQLPEIYPRALDIVQWRAHFETGLNSLSTSFAGPLQLLESLIDPPYALAYQACDDRELLEHTGRFFQGLLPAASPPSGREAQTVVLWGSSAPLWQSGSLALLKAWSGHESLQVLSSSQVWVAALESQGISACWLPPGRASYLEALAHIRPERLLFSDLRTPLAYTLALTRQAPFQGVWCLQPETSGLNTLDAFFSSELIEPPEAAKVYTERLLLFKEWPIFPALPLQVEPPATRRALGLPELGHLYFCPARLAKIHPDFDQVLQAILALDRRAFIYLFYSSESLGYTYLQQRFDQTLVRRRERVRFLPCTHASHVLHYLQQADVVIDSPWFGARSAALWALSLGVPVLTWEGPWMRGRWAAAFNRLLGLSDFNVSDLSALAQKAVEVAADFDRRAILKQELPARVSQLWNPVAAAEAFVLSLRQI